jgi:hypothetical protein
MRGTIALILIVIHFSTYASDESFNWLKSTSGENSSLSGECDYVRKSQNMICSLRQLSVRKKTSEDKTKQQVEDAIQELDEALVKETIDSYIKSISGDICNKLSPERRRRSLTSSEVDAYNSIEQLCDKPTKKKLLQFYMISIEQQRDTCKVVEYDVGTFEFEKINENKWVSTNSPKGECSVVSILSLERSAESSFLWAYSQVKHYTNTKTELCKTLAENVKPMSYSWNGKTSVEMNCKHIEFGM